jgi:hypothetical protein
VNPVCRPRPRYGGVPALMQFCSTELSYRPVRTRPRRRFHQFVTVRLEAGVIKSDVKNLKGLDHHCLMSLTFRAALIRFSGGCRGRF